MTTTEPNGELERQPESQWMDDSLAMLWQRLELALYGKIGNAWERGTAIRIESLLKDALALGIARASQRPNGTRLLLNAYGRQCYELGLKAQGKVGTAMWALIDHLKALGHPFETWPDAVKWAFSDAMIADDQTLTPDDIKRGQEIAQRHGWLAEVLPFTHWSKDPLVPYAGCECGNCRIAPSAVLAERPTAATARSVAIDPIGESQDDPPTREDASSSSVSTSSRPSSTGARGSRAEKEKP